MDGLRRSDHDKFLAGVCGGLGEYFNIEPNLVRLGFVLATVFVGAGAGIYIVLWLILPSETRPAPLGGVAPGRDPVRIAEERYARGEMTAEELERIKADLARGGAR